MIPVVLKPKVHSLRHRWQRGSNKAMVWTRDGIIAFLTAVMMVGTYLGGQWALQQTQTQLDFAYFHPSLVLGLVLVFLLLMLFITNLVSALGALFLARDLDFVLSSPIPPIRFFRGKVVEIIITSSWMTMVFLLPLILAFGIFYDASSSYYVISLLVYVPYFLIPAAAAIILATMITSLFPAQRRRELLFLVLAAVLYGLYLLAKLLSSGMSETEALDVVDILELVSFLSIPNTDWSPSFWAATILGEILEPTGKDTTPHLSLLYMSAITMLAMAFLALSLFHFRAYSLSRGKAQINRQSSKRSQERLLFWLPFLSSPVRALITKEFKTASRDITQSFQAFLLLGLCALYLYMLRLQHLFNQVLPESDRLSWRWILVTVNACLEAFVITSMGTRLVFPSISREAQSFWILQAAPMPLSRILRIKWHAWWFPIALITSLVFGVAALILYNSAVLAVFKVLCNCLLCFGLVGMGMGLGAYFAEFDWEHPSQLTTGFGSLVYMLSAVVLIAVNLFVFALIISYSYIQLDAIRNAHPLPLAVLGLCGLALIGLNYGAAKLSLLIGEKALNARF